MIGALWITYVLIIIISFVVVWWGKFPFTSYLLLAFSIIGLLTVIIWGIFLNNDNISNSDAESLSILLIIAFIVPIIIILYIIWTNQTVCCSGLIIGSNNLCCQ